MAPDTEERVRRILPHHELMLVNDMPSAKATLEADGVSLVLVGARFDESRMFDLLEFLRDGASVFVNLNDFDDDETQNLRLRIMVDALLLPPHAVPAVASQLPTV